MATKEAKKVVKTYNKIARTIIEYETRYETLWLVAWTKGIASAKSGLLATLIVGGRARHSMRTGLCAAAERAATTGLPGDRATGKLYVNFDRGILQLLRETKALMRIDGVEVPEEAKMVVMQEDKFKHYYNLLHNALREYEHVLESAQPIRDISPQLLEPHLAELFRVIQPAMISLTWTSMNIDAFLHRFHAELARFSDLVTKMTDIMENRVGRNLVSISELRLVDLPSDESMTLDKFVHVQERHVKEMGALLGAKNVEVEEAVLDLARLVKDYTLQSTELQTDDGAIRELTVHYAKAMYRAVLACTQHSLDALKQRVGSRAVAGFLQTDRPFFDVQVELELPNVVMSPPLGDIQTAINRTSRAVLGVSKGLKVWRTDAASLPDSSIYEVVTRDREVIRVVLLLAGSVEGAKRQVQEYLQTFLKYEYLWVENMAEAYATFMAKAPTLEDFEAELKVYVHVDAEIGRIPERNQISALSLETRPLKLRLSEIASQWKSQYAQNLHSQAAEQLAEVTGWLHDMKRHLAREISDLDDVRMAMRYLGEIRDREAMLDWVFSPVEEKYALLDKYEVNVPKEETDTLGDLRFSWKKLKKVADDMTDKLRSMQSGFRRGLVRNVKMFVVDVVQFRNDFEGNGPMVPGIAPMEANERLRKFQRLYEERERKFEAYRAGEELFGLPITSYPELEETQKELTLLEKLYGLYSTVLSTVAEFNDFAWADVQQQESMDMMTKKMEEFQAACKRMPKDLRSWDAFVELKKTVDDFLETLPLIQMLAHPSLRGRHWTQLQELTGKVIDHQSEHFKLSTLLEIGLLGCAEEVEEIANAAVKELAIEKKLEEFDLDWATRTLTFGQFKSRGNIVLNMGATVELMEALEETQMALGSMMASRYITPFKEDVQEWIVKLSTVSEQLEIWVQVQAMWQYLEAVFTSGDIAKQLPQESKRFQGIDKNWVKIMTKGNEQPIVVAYIYGNDSLKQVLPMMLEQLELCQKALPWGAHDAAL